LGVTDSAAGTWKAHQLDGAKRLFVEVERTRRPANDQIRRDARVTAGNGLDHGIASWGSAEICGATPSVRAAPRQRQRRSDPERLDFLCEASDFRTASVAWEEPDADSPFRSRVSPARSVQRDSRRAAQSGHRCP